MAFNAHTGMANSIREVLRTSPEPMSCYQIALALGKKQEKVKVAISQLIAVTGSIVASKGPRGVVYSIYKPPEREKEAGNRAGRIEIGRGSFWGAGLV